MDLTLMSASQVFDSPDLPADPRLVAAVHTQVADADLAAPPVILPDFHHKSKMELPSSVAVATLGTVRPTLTSASVNCGMALLTLSTDRPSDAAVDEFYRRVRERYPYPTRNRGELTGAEVKRAAVDGARFAGERWQVEPAELERIEEFGRIELDRYGGGSRLLKELPELLFQLARLRFGTVGPSNHFIELQQVEEIFDEQTAAELGVAEGQLTLQYHAGGGVLTGEIGALFGRRKHYPRQLRLAMAVQKPLYHLASARSMLELRQRLALYFSDGCPPVDRHSDEGERLMLANAAAMNYGFAFRVATYAALRSIASQVFGAQTELVVDSPHNSIYEEPTAAGSAVVHRHNACRAYPAELMPAGTVFARTGQAVLLPGTHRTSSYLAVAGPDSARSLHSACHGAGTVIDSFVQRGVSSLHPGGHVTRRFRYSDEEPQQVAQFDDRGVDAALSVLIRHGLVRPIARMRPFAVLN